MAVSNGYSSTSQSRIQQVKADGILNLTLPKLEQEQNRVFKVNLVNLNAATSGW